MKAFFLKFIQHNIYIALILQMLLLMVLLSLSRIAFYFFNLGLYTELSFSGLMYILWGGLQFDLAAILYCNLLFIILIILPFPFRFYKIYKLILKVLFIAVNSLILAANSVDMVYFKFTGKRTTAEVFQEFANEKGMGKFGITFLLDFWYIVVLWAALVFILIYFFGKIRFKKSPVKNRYFNFAGSLLFSIIVIILTIGGLRGGFRHSTRPIAPSNAGKYIEKQEEMGLVLNTPFTIIRTLGKKQLEKLTYFEKESDLEHYFNPQHQYTQTDSFSKENVVIIILESFGQEYIAYFDTLLKKEYGTFTPFLDSLLGQSYTLKYAFGNGRKSIDALPSITASLPMVGSPFIISNYYSNQYRGLGKLLSEEGYHTSFFHGAPNGSMGFDAFIKTTGIEHYFGMNEYGKTEDFGGLWGIWDEEFFQFWAQKMNEFPQPFFSAIFSVSSHHPFTVPVKYESLFKDGPLPVYKTVAYTDMALRKFFETASKQAWYNNTLFVITADHASTQFYKEYANGSGAYKVPLMFYTPSKKLPSKLVPELAEQIDIMPSVLDYLHYSKPFFAFGRSIFDSTTTPFAFNYDNGLYQYYMGDYLLQFTLTDSPKMFRFKTDNTLKNNVAKLLPDSLNKIMPNAKAFIQQYHNRMIDNNLGIR